MTEKLQQNSERTEKPENWKDIDPEKYAELYLEYLGLTIEDLENKKVLEVGPADAVFAKIAKKRGIDIFTLEKIERFMKGQEGFGVRGDALRPPFADEVFDIIFSRNALPSMLDTQEEVKKFFEEVQRMLKKGGRFVFTDPARGYFTGNVFPSDADAETPGKTKSAIERMEADIETPIESININCENVLIGMPAHIDTAYQVRKK